MSYVTPISRPPKIRYVGGIDPDKDKSGHAVYCRQERKFVRFEALEPLPLLKAVKSIPCTECEYFVEAGWQNQGMNTYQMKTLPKGFERWTQLRQCAYMFDRGTDVGINFGAGYWIISLLRAMDYKVTEYRPTIAKWDAAHLRMYTGITERTNQDTRDAIRAAFMNK